MICFNCYKWVAKVGILWGKMGFFSINARGIWDEGDGEPGPSVCQVGDKWHFL
jgi:hypothetical protein